MSRPAQLALDLVYRPALGREDFMVAPSNRDAVAWIDRWPAWPGPALALHGPSGCGKSHLAAVWRALSGAVRLDGAALGGMEPRARLGAARACALDDVEAALAGEESCARHLLHLHNSLVERGGHLLLIGRDPPARWPVAVPDLRSRLAAIPAVALAPPDDALIGAVLVKLLADRQQRVAPPVLGFLLARMERSFAAARTLVGALDRAALAGRRKITVPLARQVLRELGGHSD